MREEQRVWRVPGFLGVRTGTWYWKLKDTNRHPLLFSDRNGIGYRRIVRAGSWEFGVRRVKT